MTGELIVTWALAGVTRVQAATRLFASRSNNRVPRQSASLTNVIQHVKVNWYDNFSVNSVERTYSNESHTADSASGGPESISFPAFQQHSQVCQRR